MKNIIYNPETHALVPREPTQAMCSAALAFENNKPLNEWGMIVFNTYEETYSAMLAAAPQPEQIESEPVPDFRGYAALGTGQYLLNACPATEVLPAELVISIATEEEKACRVIGDLKYVEPGTEIDPSSMAVRLAFFSVSGLDALEQQLRILREESFPNTIPQPYRTAELEAAAPQPEPNHNWCAGCSPDNCSGCGAEPVDSEPAMWVMKHIRSGDLAQAKPNQKALHPRMWSQEHLYTTPQPDRVAELSALKTENATAWAQANRLALELECLLLDTKDNATVSKWWDSGMEALSEYQQLKPGAKEEAEAWAKMRKEMK